jgi:hypothetical protein
MPARRMLCTRCGATDRPDTRIGGSDLLEIVGWALLLVPGALYCWWRHASRQKVCSHCGSAAVVREARAASERADAASTAGGQLVFAADRIGWLAPPGVRLRKVRWGGAAAALGLAAFAFVSLDTIQVQPAAAPAPVPVVASDGKPSLYTRQRQCERRCNSMHRARTYEYRGCVDRCIARVILPGGASACGEMLDAATCEFAAGH